jgi:COP9 signalosome complex subunit 5
MAVASGSSSTAQKTFELSNQIEVLDPDLARSRQVVLRRAETQCQIYKYDAAEQKEINNKRPWRADPHHFKKVKVSATALIKMVMHARSGGAYEVMGLMQGKLGPLSLAAAWHSDQCQTATPSSSSTPSLFPFRAPRRASMRATKATSLQSCTRKAPRRCVRCLEDASVSERRA